jgi:LPXTG-motif cell wall-anchored protein
MTVITAVNFSTKEEVVDIGNLNITHDKPHHLNWSPIVGIVVIGIGGLILWKSKK